MDISNLFDGLGTLDPSDDFWNHFQTWEAERMPSRRRPARDDDFYIPRPVYRTLPDAPECVLTPGETPEESDRVLERIISGEQTAFLVDAEMLTAMGGRVPVPGGYRKVMNRTGTKMCVIRSICTELIPYRAITWARAELTGEARHLAEWMENTRRYELQKAMAEGRCFNLDTLFLFDQFEVRYWESIDEEETAETPENPEMPEEPDLSRMAEMFERLDQINKNKEK